MPSPSPSNTLHASIPTSPSSNTNLIPPSKCIHLSTPVPSSALSKELGKYIQRDIKLIQQLGWMSFVQQRRQRRDLSTLHFQHKALPLLQHIKKKGMPVILSSPPWSNKKLFQSITRGPHRSCHNHIEFLESEFIDMIQKNQWVILPYSIAKQFPNLRISPGVVPQRNRRPRWIGDYTWSNINNETQPLSPNNAMQFGHALDRYLREILLADPSNGPIYMSKLDIADGFYRLDVAPYDIPKLALAFPTRPTQEPLVALPLVLPMGWKNSPPYFCAATETAADLANKAIQSRSLPAPHPLESHAAALDSTGPIPASTEPSVLPVALTLENPSPASTPVSPTPCSKSVTTPIARDPCLPSHSSPVAYVDVFVDDFIALCQGSNNEKSRVRQHLLHSVDRIFRPNDAMDNEYRREPVSIKKLNQGDLSWSTEKKILGWVIDTGSMTINLPPHRAERLHDILHSIPPQQKRISIKKWHKILGELRSMSLAIPGARNLFSTMQHALLLKSKSRIALRKDVHASLSDFKWMHKDLANRPTRIAEVIPLNPCAIGFHDASSFGAGGVWFANPELQPRAGTAPSQPLLWRIAWPSDITNSIVSSSNPHGSITNSDLELAGGLLHLDIIANNYDTRERTILSKTDNLATLFWQRKGSTTTTKAPAHLLRLFGLHQRVHRYVPRHDYIPGASNPMADDASRLLTSSNQSFLSHFNSHYPQKLSYKLVTPSSQLLSYVISILRKTTSSTEFQLEEPPPPTPTGQNGLSTPLLWASTPFSTPSTTKFQLSKSSSAEFARDNLLPYNVQSSLAQLKTTYGQLPRRTSQWEPQILG